MPGEFSDHVGEAPGLSVSAIAGSLRVPEQFVMAALRAGCRNEAEVREWLRRGGHAQVKF